MAQSQEIRKFLEHWRRVLVASVRAPLPDLGNRQMAVLLTVYLCEPPHTVRGLARTLKVHKPVITRALDTLSRHGLVRRKRDPDDRRSVLVLRTVKGAVFLSEFHELAAAALAEQNDGPKTQAAEPGEETPA
ncbi:MAG: MarR family transcriptional regulator [Alphaproteobacteria bacterium]|nr:MAG: MarR family transcriptional regulator [Alphaproteobacteria bacterium]